MTIVLSASAIVSAAGALTYGLANGKLSELGRLAFAVGLLALLMHLK